MTSLIDNAGITHAVSVWPDVFRTGTSVTVSCTCRPHWFVVMDEEVRQDRAIDCMSCLVKSP